MTMNLRKRIKNEEIYFQDFINVLECNEKRNCAELMVIPSEESSEEEATFINSLSYVDDLDPDAQIEKFCQLKPEQKSEKLNIPESQSINIALKSVDSKEKSMCVTHI